MALTASQAAKRRMEAHDGFEAEVRRIMLTSDFDLDSRAVAHVINERGIERATQIIRDVKSVHDAVRFNAMWGS